MAARVTESSCTLSVAACEEGIQKDPGCEVARGPHSINKDGRRRLSRKRPRPQPTVLPARLVVRPFLPFSVGFPRLCDLSHQP